MSTRTFLAYKHKITQKDEYGMCVAYLNVETAEKYSTHGQTNTSSYGYKDIAELYSMDGLMIRTMEEGKSASEGRTERIRNADSLYHEAWTRCYGGLGDNGPQEGEFYTISPTVPMLSTGVIPTSERFELDTRHQQVHPASLKSPRSSSRVQSEMDTLNWRADEDSGSEDEGINTFTCCRSPVQYPPAQPWRHRVCVRDPEDNPWYFLVDEHTNIAELKKYINRYLGWRGFHLLDHGDILPGTQQTYTLPTLHIVNPLAAGAGTPHAGGQQHLVIICEDGYLKEVTMEEDFYSGAELKRVIAGHLQKNPEEIQIKLNNSMVTETDQIFVTTNAWFDVQPVQAVHPEHQITFMLAKSYVNVMIQEDIYSGKALKNLIAQRTHIAQGRLTLKLGTDELWDEDHLPIWEDMQIEVSKGPPLHDRTRRKRARSQVDQEAADWAMLDAMDDEHFEHELQRNSLLPGTLPEAMIEQPVFFAWGGGDEEMIGKAVQKAKECKLGYQNKQLHTIFTSDAKARTKVNLSRDTKTVAEITTSAAKRLGMKPMVVQLGAAKLEGKSSLSPRRLKPRQNGKDQENAGQAKIRSTSVPVMRHVEYALDPDQFNLSVTETLTPGDKAITLVHSKEDLERHYMRCKDQGNAVVVASERWDDVCMSEPITCRLVKKTRHAEGDPSEEVVEKYDVAAFMYVISGEKPQVKQFLPDIEVKSAKSTVVMGLEFLENHANDDILQLFKAKQLDSKKLLEMLKPEFAKIKLDIVDLFAMMSRGIVCKCLVRIHDKDKDILMKSSGMQQWFATPALSQRDQTGVIWFSRREAETSKEAVKLMSNCDSSMTLGVAVRYKTIDGKTFPIYGVRTRADQVEDVRQALHKRPGIKYLIGGVPADWAKEEIQTLAQTIAWPIQIANSAPRIRNGKATWCVYAEQHPLTASRVVKCESERITLTFRRPVPPSVLQSMERRAAADQPVFGTTWSHLTGQTGSERRAQSTMTRGTASARSTSAPRRSYLEAARQQAAEINEDGEKEAKRPKLDNHDLPDSAAIYVSIPMPATANADVLQNISEQIKALAGHMNALSLEVRGIREDHDDLRHTVSQIATDQQDWDPDADDDQPDL